jgi:phenylacetate-CoA ligase
VQPDGSPGELVFTSLTKQALPIIRYRTRDLTQLLPPTARSMRRMAKIVGRSDDMLIVRGVNVFPTQIEELILQTPSLAPHYVLELTREGPLDALAVHVEAADAAAFAAGAKAATLLIEQVKAMIGISVRVEVREPGSIERSIGKAKRVIDKRTPGASEKRLGDFSP